MTGIKFLDDLDLAALLCSRVCHDVISPVGAIANGLEVLEEEDDEEMRKIAMDLVTRSAKQASAKLKFCRIAFGAAGSAGANIDMGEAGDIAQMFVGDEKASLDWQAPRETRPKQEVKLLLNMMLMGLSAIPRGGRVTVALDETGMRVCAEGERARIPEKSQMVLDGELDPDEMDARLVQVYYATRLAQSAGYVIAARMENETTATFTARQSAATADSVPDQAAEAEGQAA